MDPLVTSMLLGVELPQDIRVSAELRAAALSS
jgi:hypothetical protein